MRLLKYNSAGQLSLSENFVGDHIPEYAILSHTWGADTEEVTFQDLTYDTERNKPGYKKIYFCGEQARRDNLQYFWVDTCCIDKSNSTELAEAINSMFRWYHNAAKCYVYLSDVSTNDCNQVDPSSQSWQSSFRKSRWFTRGWTLQELIAPRSLEFFCSNSRFLGDKKSLERQLHEITGIAVSALQGTDLSAFSVNERMLWAKSRETKREEDKVYSLLGIFDIYMPLIYGEGANHALKRLEEELQKRSKKHRLDEASTVFSNPPKRSKTLHSQSLVPSRNDSNSFDPESPFSSEYTIPSADTATKQSIIDQLYFPKIDERLTSLTAAQGKTCRWFLAKSEYISWHNVAQQSDHGGFLWIKGNPGTGKSTLMKLLFEEAKLNAKSNPSKITLSFFFLARGTVEEKSTTGLYRSLLHQLFEKAVELRGSLEWMTADGVRVIERNGWNEEALKQTLRHTILKLGNRSLMIFVDALDECNQNQAEGMVCFFEDLVELAQIAQVQLQICFSSRHYPTVTIQKGVEIILEDEIGHTEDIEKYIRSKLRLGKSKPAESKQAELLRSEILEKSSRIFLWVVLVLDILNSEYPNTSISIKEMRKRLKEIPPKLADLFEMVLTRDEENIEQLHACLKLILFTNRPLKPQELYFAIQLNLNKECSGYWDQEDVDLHQIKGFVRSSSKGLAEVTRNKAAEVQFIHESVREYLLDKYESQWSGLSSKFIGHGHEVLRNCCLAQLNAPISREIDMPDPLPQASKASALREAVNLKFPFLGYSVLNTLYHSNSAQQNAIEQGDFLAEFPLQQWIFLNNLFEQFDIRRYKKSASILYILAERNLADLIRIYPYSESCFDFKDERYGPPVFAALATDSNEAAQALIRNEAKTKPPTSPLHNLCKQYCPEMNSSRQTSIKRDFTFLPRRRNVLSHIAEHGDEILLLFLLDLGKYIPDIKDKNGRTPLWWAAEYGHERVAKLLLDTGKVEIDSKDKDSHTPLFRAAAQGREGVIKLLLDTGKVEIDWKDKDDRTPLLWAAAQGREGVVKLLLDTGKVEIDSKDKNGRTPLWWAAWNGNKGVVKLLLDTGKVEIDSKDKDGQTPLSHATQWKREGIVKLLLNKGSNTNIESRDKLTL
ncbi:Pfs NB-ARC and Ankyrin domain protein [Rutstroemia sp. NJR-2017a BVV2]|nr:Pfs NB-ARC and Ankyrin domain protein [Rutstroemia sp. NJR-2017a BVV2]